jgi:hypothetical protein
MARTEQSERPKAAEYQQGRQGDKRRELEIEGQQAEHRVLFPTADVIRTALYDW